MRKVKSIASVIGALLAINLFNHQTLLAQQQSSLADSSETVELRRCVKELEERLNKLEAGQPPNNGQVSFDKTTFTVGATPSPATNPAPSVQGDDKVKSTDQGVLNFLREVEVSGFIDGYYSYNFNKPGERLNVLRNFDTRSNQFALNLAEIVIEKKPDPLNSRLGFRLDLDYGPATDLVHSVEPGGKDVYKVIQQAYGSYLAPIGSGLQMDFGKFVTVHGAEVIETKDNWNYSRGLLFAWAIPYYHFGVRAKYALNSKVSVTGLVVNGWNNVEENNGGKTFGVTVGLTPTPKLSIVQNYMTGPEQANDNKHYRHLSDTTVTYSFNKQWALMGNYDYGIDTLTAGGKAVWQGVAGYLRYAPTERLAFTPRYEWFDDRDGFSTGTAQRIKEFTMTGEYKLRPSLITRFEFRRDWSNQPFFAKSDPTALARSQSTVLAGLIWTFSTRDQ